VSQTAFDPVEFLVKLEILKDPNVRVEALTGGYLNKVFRLRGEGVDWVVKCFMPETELALFPNLPMDERKAMYLASTIGRAPEPLSFIWKNDGPVLVYQFCEGEIWQEGVGDVARLLHELRTLDATEYKFREVPMSPSEILIEGEAFLPKIAPDRRARLVAVRPEPIEIDAVPRSFLHTDIGPGNIIVEKGTGRLVVIDWQCPAAGDPIQDAIAFLSPGFQILYSRPPLSRQQEQDFFTAYDDAAFKARYDAMLPFYDWRMAGYCAMRIDKYATSRPAASERYTQAFEALLQRLGA